MRIPLIILLLVNCLAGSAQQDPPEFRHNLVKVNLYSLLVKNYSVSYERFMTSRLSLQLGFRYQPYSYLFDNPLGKLITKHTSVNSEYLGFRTSNTALTLDLRYYTGKKPGRGFYAGVYGRYATFDMDNLSYSYVTGKYVSYSVPLVSNLTGYGGGFELGYQWVIKKRIVIEYYLLGGQYGKMTGSVTSNKDLSGLTPDERNDLKSNLEEMYTIAGSKYLTANVTSDGVDGKISGPFWGIRSGLWIGIAF